MRLSASERLGDVRGHRRRCRRCPHRASVRRGVDQGYFDRRICRLAKSCSGLFVTVLLIALLLAVPGQSLRVLGTELVVLAVMTATVLQILDRQAKSAVSSQAIARVLEAIVPNTVTSVLLVAAGIVLLAGAHAGLYVLISPVVIALVGGVVSAWLLLIRVS